MVSASVVTVSPVNHGRENNATYQAEHLLSSQVQTHDKMMIGVLSVVPHPRNRSGDPVKSLRTMQLNGTVAKEGYDPVEANSNGVAVEQKPAVAGGGWVSLPG